MNNDFKKGIVRELSSCEGEQTFSGRGETVAREKAAIDAMLDILLNSVRLTHEYISGLECRLEPVSTDQPETGDLTTGLDIYGTSVVFRSLQELYNIVQHANARIEIARIKLEI